MHVLLVLPTICDCPPFCIQMKIFKERGFVVKHCCECVDLSCRLIPLRIVNQHIIDGPSFVDFFQHVLQFVEGLIILGLTQIIFDFIQLPFYN